MSLDEPRKRRFEQGDEHGIVRLFEDVYGHSRSLEHWRWKFSGNLFGTAPIRLGVDTAGEPVAHYAVCPVPMKLGDRIVTGAQSLDTMIAPSYQRKGLMTDLARQCYEDARSLDIRIVYGYPNERSYHPLVRKLGFRDLGRIPRYELKTSVLGSLGHLPPLSRLSWTGRFSRYLDRFLYPGFHGLCPETVHAADSFEPRHEELCEHGLGGRFMVHRSTSYLNWRYRDFPDRPYLTLNISDPEEGLTGFAVIGVKGTVGFIAELVYTSFAALRNLTKAAALKLRRLGVGTLVGFFLLEDAGRESLKDAGFVERSSDLVFCLKYLGENPPADLFSARSWYVSFGDTDGI